MASVLLGTGEDRSGIVASLMIAMKILGGR